MKTRSGFICTAIMLIAFWVAVAVPAAALDRPAPLPAGLEEWAPWVLHGLEDRLCPTPYNKPEVFLCRWPSTLGLAVDQAGGRFRQEWLIMAESWVPLPGGAGAWPVRVTVDGAQAPCLNREGLPSVLLGPGRHVVEGRFEWPEMPEMIRVPPAAGLISLSINGKEVRFPVLQEDGRLWLQKRVKASGEEDRREVRIQRLLSDTIPMQVDNRLIIDISGRGREITLENVLLPGSVPMALESRLPARLGSKNELKIQARPGRWIIRIRSRFPGPIVEIGPVSGGFGQEVWAFQAQNHLRMVKISGPTSVDPGQTDTPDPWRRHPTFLVDAGMKMVFDEIRRGDPDPAPDRLSLHRTLWLDFDGRGFTVEDKIDGKMSRHWYLAMNPPGMLGRVTVDGRDALITAQGRDAKPGVELRRGDLKLIAESRLQRAGGSVPAVGWDHDFQSVAGTLNLPPGWKLLAASGVDILPGTWFEKWTLLDLFLVLIIGLASFKLVNWRWGLLALVTVGLTYHEPGAPRLVWLNLLAAQALLSVLPAGWARRLANGWRWLSVVTLLVLVIPFMVGQVRFGLYPQLDMPYRYGPRGMLSGLLATQKLAATIDDAEMDAAPGGAPPMPSRSSARLKKERPPVQSMQQQAVANLYERKQAALTQDPNARIQTGPGIPKWSWLPIPMKWNGPVDRDQEVSLWLLSPGVNFILCLLRVILLAGLTIGLIGLKRWWQKLDRTGAAAALAALCLVCAPMASVWAGSDMESLKLYKKGGEEKPPAPETGVGPNHTPAVVYPPPALLEELKQRLLEPPVCQPACAHIAEMDLNLTEDLLTLVLTVHAQVETAVPLPGSARAWMPQKVLLDGAPARGLLRDRAGVMWLLAPAGIHTITLTGLTPPGIVFQAPLPLRPSRTRIRSQGWDVQGIHPDGRAEANLQFTRKRTSGPGSEDLDQAALPPFLHIERVLYLGLTWEVLTTVKRVTPTGSPVVVAVPLVSGESVTTAGIRVRSGRAELNMGPGVKEVRWRSTLEVTPDIQLKFPKGAPWTETWVLDAGPIWHCELGGIPVIHHQDAQGHWRPEWRPWPGETVTLRITRPQAVAGRTVTIDRAELVWTPGQRFNKAELKLNVRASQGGQHRLQLPPEAKLQQLKVKGRSLPIGRTGREVIAPLQPGAQEVFVEWHEPSGSTLAMRGPEVRVGDAAVNARVTFKMPRNRWILWTSGPRLGPAVLFWSYLVVVILAALGLGLLHRTPLKTRHWILLGLGLTQIHPIPAIIIVGWLLVLGLRARKSPSENWVLFDLAQIGLVIWTVAAMIGLYAAIQKGLLGIPHMQIAGNHSTAFQLHWTRDRIGEFMPRPWVLSVPRMAYHILMLLWALWLALSLLKWLRWGWHSFGEGGLWKMPEKKPRPQARAEKRDGPVEENFQIE